MNPSQPSTPKSKLSPPALSFGNPIDNGGGSTIEEGAEEEDEDDFLSPRRTAFGRSILGESTDSEETPRKNGLLSVMGEIPRDGAAVGEDEVATELEKEEEDDEERTISGRPRGDRQGIPWDNDIDEGQAVRDEAVDGVDREEREPKELEVVEGEKVW